MRPKLILSLLLVAWLPAHAIGDGESAPRNPGEYLLKLAGCTHCHTAEDGQALAGGRGLETPFGTFYTPNITPHREHGIGAWSLDDLRRALRHGESPGGSAYFPAFPYPAYTQMSDADVRLLYDHLMSRAPVAQPNRPHDLPWYLNWRFGARVWQWLFFDAGEFQPHADKSPVWNRGAYIAEALAHCGECHTPRDSLGVLKRELAYSGSASGPDGEKVPNITSHREDGIGRWSDDALEALLRYGELPNGEYVSGSMEAVVNGISELTDQDRAALIEFLRQVPPLADTTP